MSDHMAGTYTIPGDLAASDDSYLPVLVVDNPFRWTFLLRNLLDAGIVRANLFRDTRVSKPLVCSIDEFENLIVACEEGANIGNWLRDYLLTDRLEPLEQFVYARTGTLRVPSVTNLGWERYKEAVIAELFR